MDFVGSIFIRVVGSIFVRVYRIFWENEFYIEEDKTLILEVFLEREVNRKFLGW